MTWLLAIGRAIAAGFDWLLRHPTVAVLALLVMHVGVHQLIIDPRLRHQRDDAIALVTKRTAERDQANANHRQTKANFRAAQARAAQLEAERLLRVEREQQEITDEVTADYRRRLADARARAEQLRAEPGRTGEHPAGAADRDRLPAAGDAAGRADGAAAHPGLSDYERLVATEQAIQLDALISWVERQAGIEVNP